MQNYYTHLADRVRRGARAAGDDLWRNPFTYGNSVGHLVTHITGNLNHYIGARIARTGYQRDRDREFTDIARPTVDTLLARFDEAMETVLVVLERLDEAQLIADYPGDEHLEKTNLGVLVLCASHMNNHIGQMVYLLKALKGAELDPPVW
jgi:uncharacterized damage-inducible protein DinB